MESNHRDGPTGHTNGLFGLDTEISKLQTRVAIYILQVPNGDSTTFTGWPDFAIVKNTIFHAQRRVASLAGIGEVQSPPGVKEKSKTAAIAQAGIYGVGELTKCNKYNKNIFNINDRIST